MWIALKHSGPLDKSHKVKHLDGGRVVTLCGARLPEHMTQPAHRGNGCPRCLEKEDTGGT